MNVPLLPQIKGLADTRPSEQISTHRVIYKALSFLLIYSPLCLARERPSARTFP
jgi:hypothetical protein